MNKSESVRFWEKVDAKPKGCWLWKAGKTSAGYGMFTRNDGSQIYAHRMAWILLNGPIPTGKQVCHDCPGGDNPACVRHLFLGTQRQNMLDASKKGRLSAQTETLRRLWRERWNTTQRGESNPAHVLTNAKVIEMRRLHAENGWGYKRLHKYFGVSFGLTQRIINRKAWTHI